jgi:sodium/bile acid cotransporter 7
MVILISSQVQVPQSHQKLKQTVVSYACVSLIFFLTGCTLKTSILLSNYSKWKHHLFVQVQSYLLTSSAIYGIVSACATRRDFMDPGLLLGMIICGCTPTTIASNVVMTRQAHGNQALTVVESTLGNFLGPFLTPLLFTMYTRSGAWYTDVLPGDRGSYGEVYRRVFKQLGLSLFLPMVSAAVRLAPR